MLEDMAIEMSGKMRFKPYKKHVGRVQNELITGECDILDLDNKLIIDTKCTWDIGTHPFFEDEANDKVKKLDMTFNCRHTCGYMAVISPMWTFGCFQYH